MATWHPGFVHPSVCVCVRVCVRARVCMFRHCSVGISSMTYSLAYQWWYHLVAWGGVLLLLLLAVAVLVVVG
jgi:hypothetical protein